MLRIHVPTPGVFRRRSDRFRLKVWALAALLGCLVLVTGVSSFADPAPEGERTERSGAPVSQPPAADRGEDAAKSFAEAMQKNTVEALEVFLSAYPSSPEAKEARERIDWLREDDAYERARKQNDEDGYREFIRKYPKSVLRDEIELRLRDLEGRKAREAAERQAQAEADRRRAELYAEAVRLDTPAAYRMFLAAHPQAPEATEANRLMAAAEARQKLDSAAKPAGETSPVPESSKAYAEALKKDTVHALETFLATHSGAPEAPEARGRIEWLREDAAYEKARKRNDEDGYREFIRAYPKSVLRDEIELRLKELEGRKTREQSERKAKVEVDKRRADAYAEAVRLDTATAYKVFLTAYPGAPEGPEAKRRAEALEADDAAFAEAVRSEESLKAYLAARPKGRHAEEARKALQAAKDPVSEEAFRDAMARGAPEALEAFLKKYPKSRKVPEARAALEALRRARLDHLPGQVEAVAPAVLVAAFAPASPAMDGRADDPVWQAASVLSVPLGGGQGPKSLRLRASHDGRNVYVLAQWSDPTYDAAYRPWVWDDSRRTYGQEDRVDDGLSVVLYRGKTPAELSGAGGQAFDADAWLWRAFWSEISGLTDDGSIRFGAEPFPGAARYTSPAGGQMWGREASDTGSPGWSFYAPPGPQGEQVPSFRRANATGSRADVRAVGIWKSGTWTVEFARALDTLHPDDLALRERESCPVSFGVYDRAEEGRFATTPVLRLEIRGR